MLQADDIKQKQFLISNNHLKYREIQLKSYILYPVVAFRLSFRSAYQLTCNQHKAPDKNKVHRLFQGLASSVRNWLHVTFLAPGIWVWVFRFLASWCACAVRFYNILLVEHWDPGFDSGLLCGNRQGKGNALWHIPITGTHYAMLTNLCKSLQWPVQRDSFLVTHFVSKVVYRQGQTGPQLTVLQNFVKLGLKRAFVIQTRKIKC